MTTPPAAAAASSAPWWIIQHYNPDRGIPIGNPTIIQDASRPPESPALKVVAGPFNTRAWAQQWLTQQGQGGISFPTPPNPLAWLGWLQEVGHWSGIIISALTDVHLYISLAWLTLGFWLLVAGVIMWILSTKTARAAGKIGATAATAAV